MSRAIHRAANWLAKGDNAFIVLCYFVAPPIAALIAIGWH